MRQLKLFGICAVVLCLCACAPMLSQKTVATLYNDDGSKMADLYNNKSYNGLHWELRKGDIIVIYDAEEVNSASVAKEAVASQSKAIGALSETLNLAIGRASPRH